MARFIDAIDLPIPIQEAFDYLAEFSNTAEWDPSVVEAEKLTEGPVGPGSRFRVVVGFAGQTLSLDYEITVFEPPSRIVLRGGDDSLESVDEVTFVPRDGGTRVTYEARIELRGLRKLADPVVHLVFQRVGQLAARGLRERSHELARTRRRKRASKPSKRRPAKAKSARAADATNDRKENSHGSPREHASR